jgi:hypothetical protein
MIAAVGVDRVHVIHLVHAAHLLLDRRGDGLLDGQRIRAGVVRLHLDFRRRDLRILRDRQTEKGCTADQASARRR